MKINITLGHNASAGIFNEDGLCICAYEEERLTKIKSDSAFPKLAIEECLRMTNTSAYDVEEIELSHWFNGSAQENKYYQPKYLERRFPNANIVDKCTHHLDHANSVWNFSGTTKGLTVVIDGFGNFEECISIFQNGRLVHKTHGYQHSLGLMYQYATSAAGLKENEDEYKLLGYEIQSTMKPHEIKLPTDLYDDIENEAYSSNISIEKLNNIRDYYHNLFRGMQKHDIARLVQYSLEIKVLRIIKKYYRPGDLIQLSGGVFYNVKLNNTIMRKFGNVCVNPVCGDQGNIFTGNVSYDTLRLGKRTIQQVLPELGHNITEAFFGDMEFGPRALGNTSTLALPTMENVETINGYNNRNTVMPMAPIVTREFFEENFRDTNKVFKSEKYMIISFDFKTMKPEWRGAAHYDPVRDVYTGRVQVLDNSDVLYGFVKRSGGILINTSLNYHGTPILLDTPDFKRYQELKNNN